MVRLDRANKRIGRAPQSMPKARFRGILRYRSCGVLLTRHGAGRGFSSGAHGISEMPFMASTSWFRSFVGPASSSPSRRRSSSGLRHVAQASRGVRQAALRCRSPLQDHAVSARQGTSCADAQRRSTPGSQHDGTSSSQVSGIVSCAGEGLNRISRRGGGATPPVDTESFALIRSNTRSPSSGTDRSRRNTSGQMEPCSGSASPPPARLDSAARRTTHLSRAA